MNQTALCAAMTVLAIGCGPSGLCDRQSAETALAEAQPGDVVRLGDCTIEGPLRVGPGVTLEGSGETVVIAPAGSGGIAVTGGDSIASVVRALAVRVEGRAGVVARSGRVELEDVTIDAVRGIALGAVGVGALTLDEVALVGPIDAARANDPAYLTVTAGPPADAVCADPDGRCDCVPGTERSDGAVCDALGRFATITATHGLFFDRVAQLSARGVTIRGFAEFGAVLRETSGEWSGGSITETLGTGLRQQGGTLAIRDVAIERTYAGLRGEPSFAISATGATLELRASRIADNERYGALWLDSSGGAHDLIAEDNGDAALWLGGVDGFEITGASIERNGFAGMLAVDSTRVRISRSSVRETRQRAVPVGMLGVVRLGDGVHLNQSTDVRLDEVSLVANERAGVVLDLGASGTPDVRFAAVSIDGSGNELGAIAGRPSGPGQLTVEAPVGWDTGIARGSSVEANDRAFTGALSTVDEIAPALVGAPIDVLAVVAPMF